jgi:hypothetical protein
MPHPGPLSAATLDAAQLAARSVTYHTGTGAPARLSALHRIVDGLDVLVERGTPRSEQYLDVRLRELAAAALLWVEEIERMKAVAVERTERLRRLNAGRCSDTCPHWDDDGNPQPCTGGLREEPDFNDYEQGGTDE